MNKHRIPYTVWTITGIIAVMVCALLLYRGKSRSGGGENPSRTSTASPTSSGSPAEPTASQGDNAAQAALVKLGFEAIFERLKQAGAKEVSPISKQLHDAVETKDHAKITRAFHEAIYDSFSKMNEAIPALKEYLKHADPFVRMQAAEKLYIAGDPAGFSTLLDIMKTSRPLMVDDQDARIKAARILAKYRDLKSVPDMARLYEETKNGGVLNAVVRLGGENSPPNVIADLLNQKQTPFGIFNLALVSSTETIEAAKAVFLNPQVSENYAEETKNIAAWALLRDGLGEPYLSHLLDQAQKASLGQRPSGGDVDVNQYEKAFKYLASIDDPKIKSFLENSIASKSQIVVQYAVVNLLFNQSEGSDRAKQVVLHELRGEQHILGTELMLNIAAQLDDPEIRAAGEAFDQRTGEKSWKLYAVERKQWPIYNWIDDYVVILNKRK